MTYTRPALAAFQALYPQFVTLNEQQYDAWATKMERAITDRYGDDQQDAAELWLAHHLTIMGVGIGVAGKMVLDGANSFDSGDFSMTLSSDIVKARAGGGLGATVYGRQLLAIQRRLFGGVRLVGCA